LDTSSIHKLYAIRLNPLIKKILKQKTWRLDDQSFHHLLGLILHDYTSMKPDLFMGLTDNDLTIQIHEMFDRAEIANYLQSLGHIEFKRSNFDIRHKEVIRLCVKEYFYLFFPNLACKMDFDSVQFLDKELIALFGGEHRITDALILINIKVDQSYQAIMIHWEQQSNRKTMFEESMFHSFCGIYFQFRKLVFPIAMFTDSATEWRKPVPETYQLQLMDYPINEYHYNIVRLKCYESDQFEEMAKENPLAYAYLPLTKFDSKERPHIKAKAINGIMTNFPVGQKQATLISLVDECMPLYPDEQKKYESIIQEKSETLKEMHMFQSIEEYFLYKGKEIGKESGQEELLTRLLELNLLNKNQLLKEASRLQIPNASKVVERATKKTIVFPERVHSQ